MADKIFEKLDAKGLEARMKEYDPYEPIFVDVNGIVTGFVYKPGGFLGNASCEGLLEIGRVAVPFRYEVSVLEGELPIAFSLLRSSNDDKESLRVQGQLRHYIQNRDIHYLYIKISGLLYQDIKVSYKDAIYKRET